MGFFNKYPYTNEHELNLDWIIAKINALKDRVKAVEDAIHDIVVVTPNDGKLTIKRNDSIIGDFTANQASDEDINIAVPENTSDLYNDSDFITSSDLPDMTDYYDKTETDALLANKADISDLPDMTDYYDKTETDTLLADKADVSDLPDMTDYYDKTETDALLADKADVSSLYPSMVELLTVPSVSTSETDYYLSESRQNYRFLLFVGAWVNGTATTTLLVPNNINMDTFYVYLNNNPSNAYYRVNSMDSTTRIRAYSSNTNVTMRVYGIK